MKRKYYYFISFKTNSRKGMYEIILKKKIKNYSDIFRIAEKIERTENLSNVIILNYKRRNK